MAVKCALLWIFFSLSDAAITSTPNSISECDGRSVSLKWVYDVLDIVVVEWKFNGNLMLQYVPSQPPGSQYTYSNGYSSAKVAHISNGEINITSLTTSDSGNYSCKTTYSSGSPNIYEIQMTLTVSDMISTNLICSYNQSTGIIDCSAIPSSITSVTINGAVYITSSFPTNVADSKTYKVCMAGDASECLNDGIQPCITLEGKKSKSVAKKNEPFKIGVTSQGVTTTGTSGTSSITDAFQKWPRFTLRVVRKWYFSSRYVFRGRVVYGIQILIVAAVTQVIIILPTVVVLVGYADQNELCLNVILPLLILGWPALAVGLYLLYKAFSGQKEWIHIEFGKKSMHRSLSDDYGIKFDTINKDKIWFKVWSRDDVHMTLYRNKKEPFLDIIIGYGKRLLEFDYPTPKPVVVCDNVLSTDAKYRIFYLTCEEHVVTVVRVLDGKEETVLKWSGTNGSEQLDFSSKPLSDIMISNHMQELRDKKDPVDTADTADPVGTVDIADTVDTKSQTGTRGEWIFFIRQGDGLYEDDDDSRVSKTRQLVLFVLFPIAWLVLPFLFLRKECSTKETKNGKDTDREGLALSSVVCCQHSIKPNAKEEDQPNDAMITENVWINTPIGRKIPLPAIEMKKTTAAGTGVTEQKKKKKKSRNRNKDSSRNDITQSQEDTEKTTQSKQ